VFFPDKNVILREVGPRDGFQAEASFIPAQLKTEVIESLADAGFSHIQAVSFVHPGKVPQMADAQEVCGLLKKRASVSYSGLALNVRGVERAVEAGLGVVEVSASASNTHSLKNAGMTQEQAREALEKMAVRAKALGLTVWASIQCAFGCAYEGAVPPERVKETARAVLDQGVDFLGLADTTGMAVPTQVQSLVSELLPLAGKTPLFLHLHDTRGLGLVNLLAALECGVTRFDTALGGMGGCPFVPGAAGNIATEDTLHLLESLGIRTGINKTQVARASRRLEAFLGHAFSGKLYRMIQMEQ